MITSYNHTSVYHSFHITHNDVMGERKELNIGLVGVSTFKFSTSDGNAYVDIFLCTSVNLLPIPIRFLKML